MSSQPPHPSHLPHLSWSTATPKGDFIKFFQYQCDRLMLSSGAMPAATTTTSPTASSSTTAAATKRLKPSRSVVRYLASIEPLLFLVSVHETAQPGEPLLTLPDPLELDFSTFFLGNAVSVALLRSLALYQPGAGGGTGNKAASTTTAAASPQHNKEVALNIRSLNLSQNGLMNDAVAALCQMLLSRRCRFLESIVLSRNEYVALQAGQMLLRCLGTQGPLGDGCHGASHRFPGSGGAAAADGGGDFDSTLRPSESEHHQQQHVSSAESQSALAVSSLRSLVPVLTHIDVDNANVPPHFVRRLERLLDDVAPVHPQLTS